MEVQLPDDLLCRVFLAGLPAADEDGFLPSRELAKLCYSFGSCSRSWLIAMKKALSALVRPQQACTRCKTCMERPPHPHWRSRLHSTAGIPPNDEAVARRHNLSTASGPLLSRKASTEYH